MKVGEAAAQFEAMFAKIVDEIDPEANHSKVPYKFSGGENVDKNVPPVLYLEEKQAVAEWLDTVIPRGIEYLDTNRWGSATLLWVERPSLIKYMITMQTPRGTHRLVNDRYAVRAKYVIREASDA